MRYDYDMFSVFPDEIQSEFQEEFNRLGINQMTTQQTGLWRDTDVVGALHRADPVVKDLFKNAGFGINHYFSGAPDGRFYSRDAKAREEIEEAFLGALAEGLDDGSLEGSNWNGFVLEDFLEYLETAEPIDEVEAQEQHAAAQQASKAKTQKKLVAMGVMALGVLCSTASSCKRLAIPGVKPSTRSTSCINSSSSSCSTPSAKTTVQSARTVASFSAALMALCRSSTSWLVFGIDSSSFSQAARIFAASMMFSPLRSARTRSICSTSSKR